MFTLLCVAAGAVVGCGVCAFGMWAFLKGQSAAALSSRGRLPDTSLIHKKSEAGGNDPLNLSQQLEAMFKSERGE